MRFLSLAINALNGSALSRLSGLKVTTRYFAVIGFFFALSAGFMLAAIVILLSEQLGAIAACLLLSGFFAFTALMVLIFRKRTHRRERIAEMERAKLASSVETHGKPDLVILAEAFIKGFINPRT